MVIKTNALIYDDRFRKEVQSLQRIGTAVTASIMEDANRPGNGHDYGDGVVQKFNILSLLTRKVLKSRWFVLVHLLEFILRTCSQIVRIKPKVVWIHDPILMVFIPFLAVLRRMGIIEKVIWDHHELPVKRIDESPFLRRVFALFCKGADTIIAANKQRLEYLKSRYPGFEKGEKGIIRNYSDSAFIQQPQKALPEDLVRWLSGREYFLVQSGVVDLRNFRTIAKALVPSNSLPAIVAVGGGNEKLIADMRLQYGEQFDKRVYLIGKVPQMELTRYLDSAIASIIFYRKDYGVNNWLCEPNRLFQALNRNRPVIVGNNPPMVDILDKFELGIVVNDDGVEAELLGVAVDEFLNRRDHMSALSECQIAKISWESQDVNIRKILTMRSA